MNYFMLSSLVVILALVVSMFRIMRECPDCAAHPDSLDELENEIRARYFEGDGNEHNA